jgi:hypothetical protein
MSEKAATRTNSNGSEVSKTISNNDSCSLLVSLPLLISYGGIVKQESSSSAVYVFPPHFPSARALFARSLVIISLILKKWHCMHIFFFMYFSLGYLRYVCRAATSRSCFFLL